MEVRKIKISPEVLKLDISGTTFSGYTFGVYEPLSNILSGATGGKSFLTDLSIPILFTQDYQDVGYYSPFDGFLSQCNEEINFTYFKGTGVGSPRKLCVYNTSNVNLKYIKKTEFTINWGDASEPEAMTTLFPNFSCHTYPQDRNIFNITLSGLNKLGIFTITKKVTIPYNVATFSDVNGTVSFSSNNGSWLNTPTSQDYIYQYDNYNTISEQIQFQSDFAMINSLPIPFTISGYTNSRLSELFIYGANKLSTTAVITLKDGTTGKTISTSPQYTSYTINTMTYYDYPDGKSIFVVLSSGITSDMIVESAITKFDYLMNVINDTEIQSSVFIERGKNSGTETFRRIGEVGSTGELKTYGYNFFDVRDFNDI